MNTALIEVIGLILLMGGFMAVGFFSTIIIYNLINYKHENN